MRQEVLSTTENGQKIDALRKQFGQRLSIIGHHYQMDEVICHTDHRGDSLALARMVAGLEAEFVVFCGVYFMAESAALLARDNQRVFLPEPSSECVMATMSPAPLLEKVMSRLTSSGRKIVPVTYVNSTLQVKAFVGRHGGSVCTSANAEAILTWALGQGDAVFFVPDRNLGANTARTLGVSDLEQYVVNIKNDGADVDMSMANRSRVLLWPGFCPIHTRFVMRQIERVRDEYPGIKIVVHPECTPDVVAASDAAGSTARIIRYVEEAPEGSSIAIGTEVNLVHRLARQYEGVKTIIPLVESECTHMTQTTEKSLLSALLDIEAGGHDYEVKAPEEIANDAKASLEKMLEVCRK